MTLPFTHTTTVRDIVNQMPKASDIFKKYRIDFCCGGNTPLETAVSQSSVSMEQLTEELAEVYEQSTQVDDMAVWVDSPSAEIIDHIIHYYHIPLRDELALLHPYVTKVAKVHGDTHPELLTVYKLFSELKMELIEHTLKEEEESFPVILKLEEQSDIENRSELIEAIKELEKEHDHAGDILKESRMTIHCRKMRAGLILSCIND